MSDDNKTEDREVELPLPGDDTENEVKNLTDMVSGLKDRAEALSATIREREHNAWIREQQRSAVTREIQRHEAYMEDIAFRKPLVVREVEALETIAANLNILAERNR